MKLIKGKNEKWVCQMISNLADMEQELIIMLRGRTLNNKTILIRFIFGDVAIEAMLSILMAHNAQKKKLCPLKLW